MPKSHTRPIVFGLGIVSAFMIGVGAWAVSLPYHRATIAPAVIIPSGNTRPVQHNDGGRVVEVMVKDGEQVAAGDLLLRLDSQDIAIKYDAAICQYLELQAEIARLQAQLARKTTLDVPAGVFLQLQARNELHLLQLQESLLQLTHGTLQQADRLSARQIAQAQSHLNAVKQESVMLKKRVRIAKNDIARIGPIAKKGVIANRKYLELISQHARLQGELAEVQGRTHTAEQRVNELTNAKDMRWIDHLANTTRDLLQAQRRSAALKSSVATLAVKLEHSVVRAPVAGTVHGFTITEPGRTIQKGEVVAHIVPTDIPFQVRAQIHPDHIEKIQPGDTAQIRLTAFNPRRQAPLSGEVSQVARSTLIDPISGISYYAADINLHAEDTHQLDGKILSGMKAEVILQHDKRTLADYILTPISVTWSKAVRE